jgi:hypothetical protein
VVGLWQPEPAGGGIVGLVRHKGHDVTHSLPSRKGPVHARGNGTRAPMPAIEELMLAMEVGGAFPG